MNAHTPDKPGKRITTALLRQSAERYRRFTEELTDYMYTVRLEDGHPVQTVHGAACYDVTGYTAEEFATDPYLWITMVVPEDRALVEAHARLVLSGVTPPPLEHRIVRKDGCVRWVSDVAVPCHDSNGCLVSYDGLIKDITERKQLEESLKESEDMFRTLAEQCPISIMRFDRHARVDFVNDWHLAKFACHKVGREFYLGRHVRELPGLNRAGICEAVMRIFHGETVDLPEVYFPEFTGGTTGWASVRAVPLLREGRVTGGILIREDLTRSKQAEAELNRKHEALRNALAEKDKFFSIIAHDLKSPMSGFLALTHMFVDEVEAMSASELRRASEALHQSAETMFAMLENLLQWARTKRGVIEFQPEPCALDAILAANVDLLHAMAHNKNITLEAAATNLTVQADAAMLNAVLRNLLSNAIKFTPRGGRVELDARRDGDMVTVLVRDTGTGMDHTVLATLFAIDTKHYRPGTEGEKSTGLGLLLCKEFVERHGGRIWAESTPGQGSTFRFSLPATP